MCQAGHRPASRRPVRRLHEQETGGAQRTARQKRAEEAAKRRQQRTERFEAASQAHRQANEQRIVQEKAARAKRDDCKKQAKEQNLHLMKRLNFIKSCMEKK
jgi:hypothetical protein